EPRVEIDVRVELSRDEVVVAQGYLLELERHREKGALLSDEVHHLVAEALDDLRARVVVLVDAVAEAHEPSAATLHLFDEGWDVRHTADFSKHAQDGLVRAAV